MIVNNVVQEIESFMQEYYLPELVAGLRKMDKGALEDISEEIANRVRNGQRIFGFGNGGSEAISEAFIYALERNIPEEFKFDAYSNPKLSEAVDAGNSELFNHRIKRSGRNGDLAVLISASGNSDNINQSSTLCKLTGVKTASISGDGKIAKDSTTKADYPLVIPIKDQQILEDATLGILYIIADLAMSKVTKKMYDVQNVSGRYIDAIVDGCQQIYPIQIETLAQDILSAYKRGNQIRVDAPNSGLLSIISKHMEHNLKWDAFQNVENRLPNRVSSGLPTYHFTGVGNDGGDGFNYAIEIDDNYSIGDIEVLFARDLHSIPIQTLLSAANRKKMSIHSFCFHTDSEYIASNVAQTVLHLTSRVINAYLLSEAQQRDFAEQLRADLAMLRQKDKTKNKFQELYRIK